MGYVPSSPQCQSPHCRLIHQQWGMNRLNNSYDVDVEMNININNIFCAITTNCDNSISQAGVNIYIYNQTIKAHGTQNLGNDKFFWFALTK